MNGSIKSKDTVLQDFVMENPFIMDPIACQLSKDKKSKRKNDEEVILKADSARETSVQNII